MRSQALYGFLIVLAACAGTRTGNPIGDDNAMRTDAGSDAGTEATGNGGLTGTGGGSCKATPAPLDTLDQDTPLGFSAADVLAFAQGEHKTKIRWQVNAGLGTAAPESDEHDLTLRVEPTSAKPRFVSYEEAAQQGGDNGGLLIDIGPPEGGCASQNALEIDVTLEIKSDGGALDEKLQGTLRAMSSSWAAIDVEVAAKDLGGSLHFTDSNVGKLMFTFTRLGIHVGLSPLGMRGELSGTFESDPDHSGNSGASTESAATGGGIAEIGTDSACDSEDGLSVTLDQKFQQFTAQDAIDLVNAAHTLALSWQDGSKAKLAIEFMHDGKAVCAVVGPSLVAGLADSNLLRMFGTLSVSTDDDRIDADWPVMIEAKPAMDGTLGDVSVVLQSPNLSQAPIEDLANEYGVHGIDASGYDGANIMFSLQFTAGTTSDLTGMLTISGLTQPMCPPPSSDPEMGSPGCAGIDITTLDSATLSAP